MAKRLLAASLLTVSLLFGILGAQVKITLPEKYRKWLDEDVVYLISRHERDIFLQLKTDRERDIFIEAFWKQRDPTPGTPQNEFREEHERRLEYATKIYGRSSPLPGWKTDRGRIYIILGPPRNIEQYTNVNGVYPTEIWFYMGDPSLALPTAFNVIFFKRNGVGDYILYSPTNDGPRSLIAESMGGFRDLSRESSRLTDDQAAYQALKQLEPTLAPQVLSLIPGQQTLPGSESLASIKLIADITASPQKKVAVDYADAILKYKDFVEVEYTSNYVPSDASLQVIQNPTGGFLVHYTIEPAKITAEQIGEKYEVRFELTGRVSDAQGKTVYQFDKDFPFTLTAAELDEVRSKSISIQDAFPLIPGTYNFDILLKNTLSKEFTGAGTTVVVPGLASSPQMSPLLLAYGAEKKPSPPGERVPFKSGDEQILCQTRKTFARKDNLVIFFEIYGLTEDLRSSGTLRTVFLREDKEVSTTLGKVGSERRGGEIVEVVALKDFTPGYYQVRVSLLDSQGREVAAAKENFEISFVPAVPRPLVISKVTASVRDEDDLYVTGVQSMNTGDLATARSRLAEAYAKSPGRPDIAVAYSQILFRLNDFGRVKEVLLPFAGGEGPPAEVLALLGQACHALGEFQEAATHYAGYLSRYGANIDILNYLGTCYFQLGNRDEALRAWTKSLELSPNQEQIKSLVESLKKK